MELASERAVEPEMELEPEMEEVNGIGIWNYRFLRGKIEFRI